MSRYFKYFHMNFHLFQVCVCNFAKRVGPHFKIFFRLRAGVGSLIRSFFFVVVLLQWITIFRLIATMNEDLVIENRPKLSFCKTYCAARGWKHFQSCLFRQHTKFNRIIVYIGMEEGSRKQTFISTDFSSKK